MPTSPSTDPPGPHQAVSFERIVELLAPALGKEKSQELISSSARNLRYSTDRLDLEQTLAILTMLGSEAGIIGVSARFAKSRIVAPRKKPSDRAMPQQEASPVPVNQEPATEMDASSAPPQGQASAKAHPKVRLQPAELVALLAHNLGTEKSREVVGTAMKALGIPEEPLDQEQTLAVLETIAKVQGVVGVVARFAKARVILRFDAG